MQKSTYKTPLKKGQPAAENAVPQPRAAATGSDIAGFLKVSSARHLKLGQLLAEWCQKPPQ